MSESEYPDECPGKRISGGAHFIEKKCKKEDEVNSKL